jgi:hypothetical protein
MIVTPLFRWLGWPVGLAVVLAALTLAGLWILALIGPPPSEDLPAGWPTVVRTVDGAVTTPMPEDLDR